MARTEDQKRDAYYLRKYGVGLDWYNARFAEQGGKCAICRRPQETFQFRLAIDHDHAFVRLKVWSKKFGPKLWKAGAAKDHKVFMCLGDTKSQAIRAVRAELKTASCRGLLCPFCNRGLRFYADDPIRLANASQYLLRYENA